MESTNKIKNEMLVARFLADYTFLKSVDQSENLSGIFFTSYSYNGKNIFDVYQVYYSEQNCIKENEIIIGDSIIRIFCLSELDLIGYDELGKSEILYDKHSYLVMLKNKSKLKEINEYKNVFDGEAITRINSFLIILNNEYMINCNETIKKVMNDYYFCYLLLNNIENKKDIFNMQENAYNFGNKSSLHFFYKNSNLHISALEQGNEKMVKLKYNNYK